MTLFNAEKLYVSAPRGNEGTVDRARLLLKALGHPERRLNFLPVTGEKGKSSIVRMLSGILAASSVPSVALVYPCLRTPKENVFVGDTPLSSAAFIAHSERVLAAVKSVKAGAKLTDPASEPVFTQEELLFALALSVAAEEDARWFVFELPSNLLPLLSGIHFPAPLAVISPCPARIPEEILHTVHPKLQTVVSARPESPQAYQTLSDVCARAGSKLIFPVFPKLEVVETSPRKTVFRYRDTLFELPLLAGGATLGNAVCAVEAATALGRDFAKLCPVTETGIAEGLRRAVLPARAELLSVHPTVLCDAADDPFSFFTLRDLLKDRGTALGSRIVLCLPADEDAPFTAELFSDLFAETDFSVGDTVRIEKGKESRVASLLLRTSGRNDLFLTVGPLPFVHAMRGEFYKALKAR